MKTNIRIALTFFTIVHFFQTPGYAQVVLPKVFGDNMVLQRGINIPVWGNATPGSLIVATLGKVSTKAKTDKDGKWILYFSKFGAGGPYDLKISESGKPYSAIKLTGILIGDVWLASGQSNMEWQVQQARDAPNEIAKADFPQIRFLMVEHDIKLTPQSDFLAGKWKLCDTNNVKQFSAVAYYFARKIHKEQNVPIGIIQSTWGGYWNQAYYPSRVNAYMPAQHAEKQLPVPVFRLLGSDPIRQYANGSTVTTLEPVYPQAGGNEQWINWFFQTFANDPSLGYNYTQAGQENSFTWAAMKKGLELQMPIIARLRKEGKVRVETMAQSGAWFRKTYNVTPATTFTVSKDLGESDKKTVWYNSRFYRLNLLWENGHLRITDIHLFNETVPDKYLKDITTVNQSFFYTLPVVDGCQWGKPGKPEGFRLMMNEGGRDVPVNGGNPTFTNVNKTTARASWQVGKGSFEIDMNEKSVSIKAKNNPAGDWFLDLYVADGAKTAFKTVTDKSAQYEFDGHAYQLQTIQGVMGKTGNGSLYRIRPKGQTYCISTNRSLKINRSAAATVSDPELTYAVANDSV